MAGGGEDKNTLHDAALGWGILGIVFLAILWLIWFYFEYQIKNAFRWLRWGEMWLVSLFVDDDYTVVWNGRSYNYDRLIEEIPHIKSTDLNGEYINAISMMAMIPMQYLFVGLIGLMGFWAVLRGPGTQYRRKLGLDGLIGVQAKTFPVISPFVRFNPGNQPPRAPGMPVPADLPAFAEALGPEEWLAYNQIPIPDGNIDERAAYIAFAHQLGPRWQGAMKMAPYKQVLLAAFCLKASRKRKEADDMLGKLALCWNHKGGLRLKRKLIGDARTVLRNKKLAEKVLVKCNQHGFETAVLMRGLATAREEGGVLAPAQFVWLRAHDRALWYPLNNLGRQSFHLEALGAMAHYKAERMTRRPIPRPKLEGAIQTITEYMKSRRARPIPQLDYSQSKKQGIKKPGRGRKT